MHVLVFSDFDKPFLLETDASKERLGPSKKNYHSSKLKFLALKWSVMEHFKEYLAYAPFVVQMDNNLLTCPHYA